ncbi:MAG TPA: CbiX/SirB N-terminal domain-containing protein [Chthoniobacterales bacterium]|jgi:sirohydrochlorin cobaltochelatase
MRKTNRALILAGHGSTLNPDSSGPTHQHAATIRERGIFQEVHSCFWKEEPSFRQVWRMVEAEEIYIVPNFISEGYFTQTVLPRELGVTGPITVRDGKTIKYCEPVGNHENMTGLLLQRAHEVAPGVELAEISLVIVGHGTGLNDNSARAIRDQVERIRALGKFGEVVDAFMEETPAVAEWDKLTTLEHVVVVPFFIADGLHSYEDIPVLLGIHTEPAGAASQLGLFRRNPISIRGRQLYYASAIGTSPLLADVILDQVQAFDDKYALASAV